MSRCKLNIKALEKYRDQVERLSDTQIQGFIESCAKELAARLLAKVIKRTPVGQYPAGSGMTGGTLRRGWTGGKRSAGANYAASLEITQTGKMYTIEIVNPIEYASYVEFGHRTANHQGWVDGRFMLTISETELQSQSPQIIERKFIKTFGEVFK